MIFLWYYNMKRYFRIFINLFLLLLFTFFIFSCSNSFEVMCTPNSNLIINLSKDNNIGLYKEDDKIKIIFTLTDNKFKPVFSRVWDVTNIDYEDISVNLVPGNYFYFAIITKEWSINNQNETAYVIKGLYYKEIIVKPYENLAITQIFEDITKLNKSCNINIINEYTFKFTFNEYFPNIGFLFDKLFYFYSLYIYFDLNNDGKYDSNKDKYVRIVKDDIKVLDKDNLEYKAILFYDDKKNHIGEKIKLFCRTGIKIKTSLFTKNFFEINKIDKIFFYDEFKLINTIYLDENVRK